MIISLSGLARHVAAILALGIALPSCAATLIHFYNFETGVVDQVGASNGILRGGANVLGGTLNLNGLDAFAEFDTAIIPRSGSFSIDFNAKQLEPAGGYIEIISQGNNCLCFYVGASPTRNIRVGDAWVPSGIDVGPVGVWTNYAVVSDLTADTTSLYINGSLAADINFAVPSGGPRTRVGSQYGDFGLGGSEFFPGAIDDVRVYSGALTAGEVALLTVPEAPTYLMCILGLGIIATRRSRGISTTKQC